MEEAESAIHLSRLILTGVGVWPNLKCSRTYAVTTNSVFFISITCIIYFLIMAQTWGLFRCGGDLDMIVDILCTANIPVIVAFAKMILLRYYSSAVKLLLDKIFDDWQLQRTTEQISAMRKSAKRGRRIAAACIIIAYVASNLFFILRLIQLRQKQARTGIRPFLFEGYFPVNVSYSPWLEVTWIMQMMSVMSATTAYSGIDGFFAVLILHLCGQLAILRNELTVLADTRDQDMTVGKKIRQLVKQHNQLNWFAEKIEETFSMMFLVQIIGCAVQYCLQGYQLVNIVTAGTSESPLIHITFEVFFIIYLTLDFYIYCYVAEKLRSESLLVSEAVYDCHWYNLQPSEVRDLMLISQRAQYPLEVTAGKFCTLSLSLFAAVCKTSLGYLSMLLAVRERN